MLNKGIVQDLVDYCEHLEKNGMVPKRGYEYKEAHFLIHLTENGEIISIESLGKINFDEKSKKEKESFLKYETTYANSVNGTIRIPEIRAAYLFGLDYDNSKKSIVIKRNKDSKPDRHEKLKAATLVAIGDINDPGKVDSPIVNAYRNFIKNWDPDKWEENEVFQKTISEKDASKLLNSNFLFCLNDDKDALLQNDPALRKRWDEVLFNKRLLENSNYSGFSTHGEDTQVPIAKVHHQVTGAWGGTGSTFACNNFPAAESYGLQQANTCATSVDDMEKYTRALNYLAHSGLKHNFSEGNSTYVFWSMDGGEAVENIYSEFLGQKTVDVSAEERLRNILACAYFGTINEEKVRTILGDLADSDLRVLEIDNSTSGRIIVKGYSCSTLLQIIEHVAMFQSSLQVTGRNNIYTYKQIRDVLYPESSKGNKNFLEKEDVVLQEIRRSVFREGYASGIMAQKALSRLSMEKECLTSRYYIQCGILKSHLMRSIKKESEKITGMVNENNTNAGYLCGRLLAVVDSLQYVTAAVKPQRTMLTTKIAAVSMNPADAFVSILDYKEYYLARTNNIALRVYYGKLINDILGKFENGIPKRMTDRDRSFFYIGIAQQKDALLTKKKAEEKAALAETSA